MFQSTENHVFCIKKWNISENKKRIVALKCPKTWEIWISAQKHYFLQNHETKIFFWDISLFVYSKREYTLGSVSVSGRPAICTITLGSIERLRWNFVHRRVLLRSRSSSKWEWLVKSILSYSEKCHYFLYFPMEISAHPVFHKKKL